MNGTKNALNKFNKHKIIARFLLAADQSEFSEEDIKEAVQILHQTLFPEKTNVCSTPKLND